MRHCPIYDVATGSWHAAYKTPGTEEGWTSAVDCGSRAAAEETCRQLNATSEQERREVKLDQQLRGIRA